jgi:hypothetical protein
LPLFPESIACCRLNNVPLPLPRDVHVLIPANVNFYTKKGFSDVIKLRVLRWEDFPGVPA